MLDDLRQNITGIVALYEKERQRSESLAARLSESESRVEEYRSQIIELNGQIDNLKLSMAFNGSSDNRVPRERLDKLIREIDKCIKLLEKEN